MTIHTITRFHFYQILKNSTKAAKVPRSFQSVVEMNVIFSCNNRVWGLSCEYISLGFSKSRERHR